MAITVDEEILIEFNTNIQDLKRELSSVEREVKGTVTSVRNSLNSIAIGVAGLGATFGYMMSDLIKTNAEFEKFTTILKTVEGSSEAAEASMDWITEFATKTPYELNQVTEAYVKLRTYGIEPINGVLETLGDTSAAMGRDILQSVEAYADALTGEFERLKEFGIRARVDDQQVAFEYANSYGQMTTKIVDNNREIIGSTLEAIWNEKYAGSMNELSGTWIGMMSNLNDSFTKFKKDIGDTGIFEAIKDAMRMSLEYTKNWLGESENLIAVANGIGQAFSAIATIIEWISTAIFGWKMVFAGLEYAWNNFVKIVELGALKIKQYFQDALPFWSTSNSDLSRMQELTNELAKSSQEYVNTIAQYQKGVEYVEGAVKPFKEIEVSVKDIKYTVDATTQAQKNLALATQQTQKENDELLKKVEEIQDALGTQLENAFMDSIRGMMDGAMDWADLMKALIKDITAEMIRLLVVKDAAAGISSAITGMFGSSASSAGGVGIASAGMSAAGSGVNIKSYIPRYEPQPASVNVYNYGNDEVSVSQSGNDIDIIINALSDQVVRGVGEFPASIEQRYGLSKV